MLGTDMVFGFPVNTTAKVAGYEVGLPNQVCGPKAVNGNYGCVIDPVNGRGPMEKGGRNGNKVLAPARTGLNRAGPRRRLGEVGGVWGEGDEVQVEEAQVQAQALAPPAPAGSPPPPPPPTNGAPAPGTPIAPAPAPGTPPTKPLTTLSTAKPATFTLAARYAASNGLFLREFAKSFAKMTTVGYGTSPPAVGATTTGKLGKVTGIDLSRCPV
jgi:hypothetical protein